MTILVRFQQEIKIVRFRFEIKNISVRFGRKRRGLFNQVLAENYTINQFIQVSAGITLPF